MRLLARALVYAPPGIAWLALAASWAAADPAVEPRLPNQGDLAGALELWLRADALSLPDGEPLHVWPDQSGRGRDLSATRGVRPGGVGGPGRFIRQSRVERRPAVRFDTATGLAASPHNPLPIEGDAALSILLVVNLAPHDAAPPFDGILGLGNPAHAPGDPGAPLAALVQINRGEDHALHFAGGWNHDASLGAGSFKPWYGRSLILAIVKQPGPMNATTAFYFNGARAGKTDGSLLEGRDTIPRIARRDDIGVYMGKALAWAGSINGDVAEVLVYSKALSEAERQAVEAGLAEKYAIATQAHIAATRAVFEPHETSFWAYQPIQDPPLPVVQDAAWGAAPIDRFVLAGLERAGLRPAPPADKRVWLRRVTFDLTGLPPAPEDIDAFLKDDSPGAHETVVNRLLDSVHYGERWGRHWLDVVRYAESTANDANAVMRYAWRYRNYVIDAFNRDLPYDQFIIEQLAGDLLPATSDISERIRRVIATGFLMVGPKALAEPDKEQSRLDIVDDQIDVLGRAFLGLTIACARCHDHKFDAVRITDYYALAGILRGTEPFQDDSRNATMWWEFPLFQAPGEKPFMVMAPQEGLPTNLRIHQRGNRFSLGPVIPRGFLQVLAPAPPQIAPGTSGRLELARWIADPKNPLAPRVMVNRLWQHHLGRGLVATSDNFGARGERPSHPELLDWLATRFIESGFRLKAMHRMIVLSNTYRQQCLPSEQARQVDPENRLLSYVARRRLSAEELRDAILVASGKLDRAGGTDESAAILWKEAEVLDEKRGFAPNRMPSDHPFYAQFAKRSIYLPVVRNMLPDVLALFDGADPNGVTAARNDTTVANQSLFMMNNPFVRDQARELARKLLDDEKATDEDRLRRAHERVLGRAPAAEEREEALAFLQDYLARTAAQARPLPERRLAAWQSYCQTLFCQNEFLYVE